MSKNYLPKLSYLFLTYNRANYVKAGLESVLHQSYEGDLEIIISDDCSTDGTFEEIKTIIANYKGPHKVKAIQTPHNCGLAGNTNNAMSHATGDWFIRADDDDIDIQGRCLALAQAIQNNPQAKAIFQELIPFYNDQEIPRLLNQHQPNIKQAHYDFFTLQDILHHKPLSQKATDLTFVKTWSREIYDQFGNIPQEAHNIDDVCQMYRACTLGGFVIMRDCPVMLYRRHNDNMCGATEHLTFSIKKTCEKERKIALFHQKSIIGYKKIVENFQRANLTKASPDLINEAINFSQYMHDQAIIQATWWTKPTKTRLDYFCTIHLPFSPNKVFTWIRILPLPLYAFIYNILRHLVALAKKIKG